MSVKYKRLLNLTHHKHEPQKKNKINKTENKQKHVKQTKHKTRLTQNLKAKHTSNAHTKTRREKEKSDKITWIPFPSMPWKNLSFE